MAPFDTRSSGYGDLCTTPACIHLASDILFALAPNYTDIDPCTDFDQLVCGSWASHHEIPAGGNDINSLTEVGETTQNTVREILEGEYPSKWDAGWITVNLTDDQVKADKENFKKIQKSYDVCMNHTDLEEQGLEPLADFVKTIVETFPAYNDNAEVHDYTTPLGKIITLFESLGIETTQRMVQTQNDFNPEEIQLMIIPPSSSDIPAAEEDLLEYLELSATLIAAVHPGNLSIKEAVRRMKSIIKLQSVLAEVLSAASEEESTIGLAEINQLAPQLNFEYVVKKLAPADFDVTKTITSQTSYFGNLSQIITETPSDVLQTFFVWKAIAALTRYVESDETNAYNNFMTKQAGEDPESPAPRWKKCVSLLDSGVAWIQASETASSTIGPSGLTWILTHFFLDKAYSKEARDLTSDIVDAIEASFLARLKSKDWVSDEVKKAAEEKVQKMRSVIAYGTDPDTLDPISLKKYYADAEVTSNHVQNVLGFAYVNVAHSWDTLGKPLNRGRFITSTLEPNAFQASTLNTMVLSAAIQQFPLYDVDFPAYMIYGGMGSVVGHELTHAFDNNGRLYDATGNKTIWWDDETIEAFNDRTKCFVKQYNEYTITSPNGTALHVDGELTLGENIADAGGVVSSFDAWKKWEKEKGKAKNLPGLDKFTHEQLFFLKWGQNWCQNTPAEQKVEQLSDEHSPNDARIKLPLANSGEFLKAFNCKKKEPTCELW